MPFQFLIHQRAIKCTHYSEPRDGLNGCCSFSVACAASGADCWTSSSSSNAVWLNRFHHFFIYICTSFSSFQGHFPCRFVGFLTQYGLYGRPSLSCVMAEKEKSTSESSSLLSTVRERPLEKSAKQSEGEGISVPHQEVNPNVKQLLREKILST